MNIALQRPYIFAKIHGIHSRFSSPDDLIQYLGANNTETVLEKLDLSPPVITSNTTSEKEQEINLHTSFCQTMMNLIPAEKKINNLFKTMLAEYEIRNVSILLKNLKAVTNQSYYDFSEEIAFFSKTNMNKLFAKGEQQAQKNLLTLLRLSKYKEIVTKFEEKENPVKLDSQLAKMHQASILDAAEALPGKERKIILPLLSQVNAINNAVTALRLAKNYHLNKEEIFESLFITSKNEQQELNILLETEQFKSPVELFPKSYQRKIASFIKDNTTLLPESFEEEIGSPELVNAEKIAAAYIHHSFKKNFYVNQLSSGPLLCFYFLLKRELLNIMLLFNCKRFNIESAILRKELIH